MALHKLSETYMNAVREKLSEERFHHSMCVSRAAVELAQQYGCDPEKAEYAGILHDVMKEAGEKEQRAIIAQGGIPLCDVEEKTPKLWHAIAGAAYAEQMLDVSDRDILNAIRYHTTGRADMGLLEKILYLADFISSERTYDGVEVMRAAARHGLEPGIFTGLAFSIRDLSVRGGAIHPDTMSAYNEMILSGETKGQPPLL